MRLFGCLIIIIPVILYLIFRDKRKGFFAPKNTYTFLYIIKVVVGVISFSDVHNVTEENDFLRYAMLNDDSFFKYCFFQSIGYILVLWGINYFEKKQIVPKKGNEAILNKKVANSYLFWGIAFFIVGTMGFMLIMSKVGGIWYFFSNLHLRRYLVSDLDFDSMILSFVNKGPLLLIFAKKYTGKKITPFDIVLVIAAGIMSGLGGRKALIMLSIECVFIYHFAIHRIKVKEFFKPSYIISGLALFLFFSTYSKFRREGAMDEFVNNPVEFYVENSGDGIMSSLSGESYVPFYVLIVDHFTNHDYWYGSSFGGLTTAIIPSSFYPQKPPVDDGMYLYSIAQGRSDVRPVMPTKSLDGTSWPLETFGSMYANFGFLGVIFGMALLGLVIGWFYKKMIREGYSFLWLIMYIQVLFTFELSTLRIFQTFLTFVTMGLVYMFVKKIRF